MVKQLKVITLPIAMAIGFLFSQFFAKLDLLTPLLIFTMLFIAFCRVIPREIKFTKMHFILLTIQIVASLIVYLLARNLNETFSQGIMICILTPTAVSAVVVAGMLGANITTMATFSLLSNVSVAIVAPVIFSFVGNHADIPFMESLIIILKKVGPLLILPFAAAFVLRIVSKKAHSFVGKVQDVSFYLWAFSLMIVIGRTVEFVKLQNSSSYALEISMAAAALIICFLQFFVGRIIGKRYGDTVAGGQSLGQKNTILAIWMAQTYLDPISSIAPASYVIWQNIVNSWQLWRKNRK